MDAILDVGGFDLARAKDVDPAFLEPEYPFESIGIYELAAGAHALELAPGPDPSIRVALFPVTATPDALARTAELAALAFADQPQSQAAKRGRKAVAKPAAPASVEPIRGDGVVRELAVDAARSWAVNVQAGSYALVMQHLPEEFALTLRAGGEPVAPALATTFKASRPPCSSRSSPP